MDVRHFCNRMTKGFVHRSFSRLPSVDVCDGDP